MLLANALKVGMPVDPLVVEKLPHEAGGMIGLAR